MDRNCSIEFRGESSLILTFTEIKIYCQYTRSQNQQYILAFYDGDPFNHISGHRKKGNGYYFLINNNELVVLGQIERPNDGKIANNGFFILNDWLFNDKTVSVAYAFDNYGNLLIKKRLKANLLMNSISASGNYCLFKTANSDTADNSILILYDLYAKTLVWKKKFTFRNPRFLTIEDSNCIMLNYLDRILILDWNFNPLRTEQRHLPEV